MTVAAPSRRGPRKAKRPPVPRDPVSRYAHQVLSGKVTTGRLVRLAAQRHHRDLEHQRTPAFPFYFVPRAAAHVDEFFRSFLTLEDGSPFLLTPWQQFCLGSLFGWRRMEDGGRRFQLGYVETGKGSGKTPCLAGVGLYLLGFDGEPAAEICSAAFDKQQGSILLNDAIRMAEADPDLTSVLDIGKYNLAHPASGSFFRAVSSEHRSKSGPRPHGALIDELHEHRDATVVNKMRAGFKGRRQPLLLEITNSGFDRTSVCWQHRQHSVSVLEGRVVDHQWFAYVCQLDPCDACYDEGYRQPKDGCEDCDDWTDPSVWVKANPSLGITIQPAYLQTQVDQARAMPSDQALVKRLNFCIWTQSQDVWISTDRWDACKVDAVPDSNPAGLPAAAGLDLSSKLDLSGLTIALRYDDAPGASKPEVVEIDGRDAETGERVSVPITLDFSVDLIPFAWIPQETLAERVQAERIPYDVWERQGKLFATPGAVIDHQAIYEFVKQAMRTFRIQRLGYDERDATMLAVKLRDEARLGDRIVAVGQAKKLSEAYKLIEVLVRSRRLRHDGHPVLGWCFANAQPCRDRLGALWIEKPAETKRIDLAVGAAMAIHELMLLPARRRAPGVLIV